MASRFFEGDRHAALYARYRPTMPEALVNILRTYAGEGVVGRLQQVADVGCGSGQGTRLLAPHFDRVLGTDVSPAQVAEAAAANTEGNVSYRASPAEATPLPAASCQLVLAVQACHWFDMGAFFADVSRLLCAGGALALVGYRLPVPVVGGRERQDAQELLADSYVNGLAAWIKPQSVEVYIDGYSNPRFLSSLTDHKREETTFCDLEGTVADLVGYCSTWSGFQLMVADRGQEAGVTFLRQLEDRLLKLLGGDITLDSPIQIRFRYFALLSRKPRAP
ncbi:putative methyltransferase DDB_G0268948 [Pollicipes pollicipes]|uniref:putative methyltransferase DDB_G0268948 n=1 Tax=Pollicipes pollicipes TaxID=41117 RepID=UPI001885340C|nr:putative methyltransferase DDB_G0268948 [Pollicipes pollicipes]XP_037071943.1 putative methyltransferase DDB_G0268948 [Pollicipes pollicipes]XP_037071944.1 putative methyltransferase DDB_G0268948 [Pollicipes pollicipes]